ncbi:MAG: reverse transcriptase-like protein [Actinomycetota bacterium]
MPKLRIHTDGGARGNPGPAGIGVVLDDGEGQIIAEEGRGIGWATNNVAEYEGLIEGLRLALANGATELDVFMDSVLVVQQMKGIFKVKHPGLRPLHATARDLAKKFDKVTFRAIPREHNTEADLLANEGIDRWLEENPDFPRPAVAQPGLF